MEKQSWIEQFHQLGNDVERIGKDLKKRTKKTSPIISIQELVFFHLALTTCSDNLRFCIEKIREEGLGLTNFTVEQLLDLIEKERS